MKSSSAKARIFVFAEMHFLLVSYVFLDSADSVTGVSDSFHYFQGGI